MKGSKENALERQLQNATVHLDGEKIGRMVANSVSKAIRDRLEEDQSYSGQNIQE